MKMLDENEIFEVGCELTQYACQLCAIGSMLQFQADDTCLDQDDYYGLGMFMESVGRGIEQYSKWLIDGKVNL